MTLSNESGEYISFKHISFKVALQHARYHNFCNQMKNVAKTQLLEKYWGQKCKNIFDTIQWCRKSIHAKL